MDKKGLQEAQNIIDALFYDGKVITGWQHTLLQNVISIAQTKIRQADVINSVCECEPHTFYEWEKDENKCSQCNKPICK